MPPTDPIRPYRQALSQLVRQGLLRELYRQGGLSPEEFAQLMEKGRSH